MELTQLEKDLLSGLKAFGVEKDEAVATMMFLQKEEEREELLDYMLNHLKATEQDIMGKVVEIVQRQNRTTTEN